MLDCVLIQTEVLALQQSGILKFHHHKFWKMEQGITNLSRFTVFLCLNPESPTGFSIQVDATAEYQPVYPIVQERHLKSFEDFNKAFDKDYSIEAYKLNRGHQIKLDRLSRAHDSK